MTASRLHLMTASGPLPARVVAGAATLPVLVSGAGDPDSTSEVLVATGRLSAGSDADAALLVDPEPFRFDANPIAGPVIVVSRWAASDTTTAFVSAFTPRLQIATFAHVRATVPTSTAPGIALLDVALLLDHVFGTGLGTVLSSNVTARNVVLITRTTTGDGAERDTHVSIVLSDAGTSELRLDAYGDGEVCTLVVPDRDAGSAPGTASAVDDDGLESLPTLFSDPIRSALLRLAAALEDGTEPGDLDRLRTLSEGVRSLITSAP